MGPADELFASIRSGDEEAVERILADDPALAAERDADGLSAVMLARYFSFARTGILERVVVARGELIGSTSSRRPPPIGRHASGICSAADPDSRRCVVR